MKSFAILQRIFVPAAIFAVAGCSPLDEPYMNISQGQGAQTFTLTAQSNKMLPQKVTTRASDPKDDAEKEVRQLYLFFFDSDGQYLAEYQNRFIGFQKPAEGQSSVKIDRSAINELMKYKTDKTVTVYAVANVEPETFSDTDGNNMPDNFEGSDTESPKAQLENYVYKPQTVTLGLPRDGMPMIGSDDIDFSDNDVNNAIIQMKALMSRIDISITLDSDVEENNLPALNLMEWSVLNAPDKAVFVSDGSATALTDDDVLTEDETRTTYTGQTLYNRNGQINLSFYMFENIQEAADKSYQYPAGITDAEKQRYKPYLADAHASAVKLHAYYTTYNDDGTGSATYDVTYTLYLGANHTDDFKVKRNHQYKNDITIKGLTQVGNNPEHITFDDRVNIVEDNPFYISILRERNHDAHFCVTPMDVYLFDGGTMTVTLGDDADMDGKAWIRMEKVPASVMETGRDTDGDGIIESWAAGTGKRDYFTTGLLGELDRTYGKSVELGHRDRVYFYIDENLKLSDREAVVTMTYKNGNEEKTRTLTLAQTHLLPVDVYDRKPDNWNDDRDGEWKPTWQKRIYMEAYEEYLDHYDPLDEYNVDHIYAGLPWAKNGSTLASSKIPDLRISLFSGDDRKLDGAVDNYYSGWGYTSYMVQEQGNPDMTLDTKPESAAEYCYNKNVRQDDNSIPWDASDVFIVGWTIYEDGSKWFLPGIREMEDALTQYYSNYNEFQTNFYWSSSAAKRRWQVGDGAGPYQEKTRARATKVLSNGKYAESAYDEDNYTDENGTGGRALRTQELRIRAFRTDLEPVE